MPFKNSDIRKVEISPKNILVFFFILGLISLSFLIQETIVVVLLSYIIYAGLNPLVNLVDSLKIGNWQPSRVISILLVFASFIAILSVLVVAIVSPTYNQINYLVNNFETEVQDKFIERYKLKERFGEEQVESSKDRMAAEVKLFAGKITSNADSIFNLGRSILGGFFQVLTVLALTFYQLSEPNKVRNFLSSLFPNKKRALKILTESEARLGNWLQGQLFLMFSMGVISFIFFRIVGLEFALPLALLVALFDIVPVIGAVIAFVPVIVTALIFSSPVVTVSVAIFYLFLQQLEGNVLVPKIMQSSVGLDPIIVLLALMVGSSLLGVIGAILSVPVAAILMIIYQDYQDSSRANQPTQNPTDN